MREIRGWEAWYSITRSDCGIRDKLAEERVQRLIDSIGESSGSEAESEEDEDGSPEAISSSTAATARKTPLRGSVPDAEALASSLPPGVGISSHPKISEAVRNAVVDVIVEGLLANQHLVGLPKGESKTQKSLRPLCLLIGCSIVIDLHAFSQEHAPMKPATVFSGTWFTPL